MNNFGETEFTQFRFNGAFRRQPPPVLVGLPPEAGVAGSTIYTQSSAVDPTRKATKYQRPRCRVMTSQV
jgi:hypothetical protein